MKKINLIISIFLILTSFLWLSISVLAESTISKQKVYTIEVEGIINPVTAELIAKGIKQAEAAKAEALLIELDTPGGLMDSMRLIIKDIINANVPVITYVYPSGSRSASAGVFIMMASDIVAMTPGTNLGAAHPVVMGGGGEAPEGNEKNAGSKSNENTMMQKLENDAAAYIRGLAKDKGRNAQWAEKAVRESVSITAGEALELKVIDFVAADPEELLQKIHAKKIKKGRAEFTLNTKDAETIKIETGWRYEILKFLSNPNVAYILMSLGFLGLYFELSNPGVVFPGVVGLICLILAFYSFQTLPVNFAGLALLIMGFVLLAAEAFVVSGGLLAAGGVVSLLLGSVMLIDSPFPFMRVSLAVIIPVVGGVTLFFILVVGKAVEVFKTRPLTGKEGMEGIYAEAFSVITPGHPGKIFMQGEIWNAESEDFIEKGEKVEVYRTQGLKAFVRKTVSLKKEENS